MTRLHKNMSLKKTSRRIKDILASLKQIENLIMFGIIDRESIFLVKRLSKKTGILREIKKIKRALLRYK